MMQGMLSRRITFADLTAVGRVNWHHDLARMLSVVDVHCRGLEAAREQQRHLEFGSASVAVSKAVGSRGARSHG